MHFNIITIGAHKIHLFTKCFELYLTCAQHYPRKVVRIVCGLSNDDIIIPVVTGLYNVYIFLWAVRCLSNMAIHIIINRL